MSHKVLQTIDQAPFLSDLKTYKETYERVEVHAPFQGGATLPRTKWIIRRLQQLPPGAKVLDVGARTGETLIPALQMTKCQMYGVELVSRHVRICQERGLNVVEAFAEHLPFGDAYFDAVTMTEILEHVIDPDVVLDEAERVLKPGGLVCLSTPFGPWHLGSPGGFDEHVREFDPRSVKERGTDYEHEKIAEMFSWTKGHVVGTNLVSYRKRVG